jgi:hypothetical protein
VVKVNPSKGRMTLSTRSLERTPGDMLRDPQLVYEGAEEMAEAFGERLAGKAARAAEKAAERAAVRAAEKAANTERIMAAGVSPWGEEAREGIGREDGEGNRVLKKREWRSPFQEGGKTGWGCGCWMACGSS